MYRFIKNLIIIILFSLKGFSQNKNSGSIHFSVSFIKDTTLTNKNERFKNIYNSANDGSKQLDLILEFTPDISKFYSVDKIQNNDTKMANALCNCQNIIYTDLDENRSLYNTKSNSRGIVKENEFLVYEKLNNEWIITSEEKKIDSFTCYKATQEIKYETGRGINSKIITAWFTPEIPYSFGPKGFFGLPGMILELQDRNNHYFAKKIDFYDTINDIVLPSKGVLISNDEYQIILKERINKIKEEDKN